MDVDTNELCIEMTSTKNTVCTDGICPTLTARMGTGGGQVNAVLMNYQSFGEYAENDTAKTLLQRDDATTSDLICAVDCRNATENAEVNGTLQSKPNGGTSYNLQNVVRERYIVRRLTPLECTRLQGYPDGWVDIGDWVDSKGKKHKDADSPKYKALGNSIAIPPWLFVLSRLNEY